MTLKVTIVNAVELQKNLIKLTDVAKEKIQHAVFKSVADVEKDMKLSLTSGAKSGRTYKRYNPKRIHKASAPGEAPASDTGYLLNNISRKIDPDGMGGEVGTSQSVKYAKMLEYGTSKMQPRPFLFPALEKNKAKITDRINKAFAFAVRSAKK